MDSDKTTMRIVFTLEHWKCANEVDLSQVHSAHEVWQCSNGAVFSHTAIVAFDGDTAYYGKITTRETEIDKDAVLKDLQPIPRENLYPQFSSHLTRAPDIDMPHPEVYIKTPDLKQYSPDNGQVLADRLLNEAEIHEILLKHPHPCLDQSLGCVVGNDGRIMGLMFRKYGRNMWDQKSFRKGQLNRCIEALEDALQHLHDLGLAHNDVSPLWVMSKDDGKPVLTDFSTCQYIGTKLTKGGQIGAWQNCIPLAEYESSSADCDKAQMEYLIAALERRHGQSQSENDIRKEEGRRQKDSEVV